MVRTELYINGVNGVNGFLSFPFGVNIPVSINFNLADVRNPEQRKASFSKTINLLGTNEVNKLFENLFEVNVVTQYFNKNLKTPVKYLVDGLENFAGDLQLIKININPDNSIVYECSIIGAGGSLFVDIGEKYITGNTNSSDDLDFSDYDHDYTRANQIASRTNVGTGEGYVYPFIDRGTNGNSDTVWSVKDFLPCFSIYEYVKKIIEGTGRTFTSTFFESSFFKHLYCYSNITKLALTEEQLALQQFYVGLTSNVTQIGISGAVTTLVHDNETAPFFDDGTQNNTTTGLVTISESGYYNVVSKVLYRVKFTHSNSNVAFMKIKGAGIYNAITSQTQLSDIVVNFKIFSNLAPSTHPINQLIPINTFVTTPINEVATGEMFLSAGDVIYNRARLVLMSNAEFYNSSGILIPAMGIATFTIEALSGINGCSFYGLVSRKEVIEGNLLEANYSLPTKIKQKEFLTSILKAFNLFVDVNPDNENDLIIEPLPNELHRFMRCEVLTSDDIIISDYNYKSPLRPFLGKKLKFRGNYEPNWQQLNNRSSVLIQFEQRINNLRKRFC